MTSPCLNCKDRTMNCHDICYKYKRFINNRSDVKKKIQKDNEFEYYLIDATFRQKEGKGVVKV